MTTVATHWQPEQMVDEIEHHMKVLVDPRHWSICKSMILKAVVDYGEQCRNQEKARLEKCWVCGEAADDSFCLRTGPAPGFFRQSQAIHYCHDDISEVIDWLGAVHKHLKGKRKQMQERKKAKGEAFQDGAPPQAPAEASPAHEDFKRCF